MILFPSSLFHSRTLMHHCRFIYIKSMNMISLHSKGGRGKDEEKSRKKVVCIYESPPPHNAREMQRERENRKKEKKRKKKGKTKAPANFSAETVSTSPFLWYILYYKNRKPRFPCRANGTPKKTPPSLLRTPKGPTSSLCSSLWSSPSNVQAANHVEQ